MDILIDKSFFKSLDDLKDKSIARSVEQILASFQKARSLSEVRHVKKLQGYKNFYRVRLGDYRLGFEVEKPQTIRFIVMAHRKDIYKKFP